MRYLFILLIVLQSIVANGQSTTPSLLAIDTSLNVVPVFNNLATRFTPGYAYLGNEKQGNNIKYVYTHGSDVIRFEYHYSSEKTATDSVAHPVITFQSIRGPLDAIINIYNGLFNTNVLPTIDNVESLNGTVNYKNITCTCSVQADDYSPGYWILSFMK